VQVGRVALVVGLFALLSGCGDDAVPIEETARDLVTRPFVAANRPLEVVARGARVMLVERDGTHREEVGSFDAARPVASVDAIANGDHVEIVLLTCATPHSRDDADLHEACDGASRLDHLRVAGSDGRVLAREQVATDEEVAALQLAGDRPVVHTIGETGGHVRVLDGDRWTSWTAADTVPTNTVHMCLTDEGGYALGAPAPSTTTVPGAGPKPFAAGSLWFHSLVGSGAWQPVTLPIGVTAGTELSCTPSHVMLTTATSTPGRDGLFVGRGGAQLLGRAYRLDAAVLTQQRSYDTNEFPTVQALSPDGSSRRTLVLDPRHDLAPYSDDTTPASRRQGELRSYHGLVDGRLVALTGGSG
jgi:hypothetical protein